MKCKLSFFIDYGMSRVAAALKTNDHIIIFGEQIDHTAFSFVTPVDSYDCTVCHFTILRYICSVRRFITSA